MPKKQFEEYFINDDWFIYDKLQTNSKKISYNHYWFVSFPPVLGLPNKSFNQLIYTKEDAIDFRNKIVRLYIENGENDYYKTILEKYLKK